MNLYAIAAVLVSLVVASAQAAHPSRKRTQTRHKSSGNARVASDEGYDPYLGMEQRRRRLGVDAEKSMSMSMFMSMSMPIPPQDDDDDNSSSG